MQRIHDESSFRQRLIASDTTSAVPSGHAFALAPWRRLATCALRYKQPATRECLFPDSLPCAHLKAQSLHKSSSCLFLFVLLRAVVYVVTRIAVSLTQLSRATTLLSNTHEEPQLEISPNIFLFLSTGAEKEIPNIMPKLSPLRRR